MGKYSSPQYLTPNGLVRSKTKPILPSRFDLVKEHIAEKILKDESAMKMTPMKRHILKKRGIALQKRQTQEQVKPKTITPEAAKALAMALKGMLHS